MKLETIGDINPYPRFDPNLAARLNKLAESQARKDPKKGTELPQSNTHFGVDAILNGRPFYSEAKDRKGNSIGVAVALKKAITYAGKNGIVTLPEFLAAKVKAGEDHDFWKNWYTVHTEENIGIDDKGRFYKKKEPVLVVVHGGGILTPDRIQQACREGLVGNSAKYTPEEFNSLLEGKLSDGTSLDLYSFEDIKKGVSGLPHQFGVVMPYKTAKETTSGSHKKKAWIKNPLVIARNGGRQNLEDYFDKAKDSDGDVGNYHPFDGRDATTPQGRVLFVYYNGSGLVGNDDLSDGARFVGVSAGGARKNNP